jgi:hypothetical protein
VHRRLNVAQSMGMICMIGGCVLSCPIADGSKDAVVVMMDVILENSSALVQLNYRPWEFVCEMYVRCDQVRSTFM